MLASADSRRGFLHFSAQISSWDSLMLVERSTDFGGDFQDFISRVTSLLPVALSSALTHWQNKTSIIRVTFRLQSLSGKTPFDGKSGFLRVPLNQHRPVRSRSPHKSPASRDC